MSKSNEGFNWLYIILGLIIVIGSLAVIFYTTSTKAIPTNSIVPNNTTVVNNSTSAYVLVPISITDPLFVPNNTKSINIYYSDIVVLTNHGKINLNQSGRFNLLNLTNYSKVLGFAKLKNGSTVIKIIINIKNGTIDVGNSTYNLTLPKNMTTNFSMWNNTSTIALIDLNPNIGEFYNDNLSNVTFGFNQTSRGIAINKSYSRYFNRSNMALNKRMKIDPVIYHRFIFQKNIDITSASVYSVSNDTVISISVKDISNHSVRLIRVDLLGMMNFNDYKFVSENGIINPNGMPINGQSSKGGRFNNLINLTGNMSYNNHTFKGNFTMNFSNFTKFINNSNQQIAIKHQLFMRGYPQMLNFLIGNNGELYLPFMHGFNNNMTNPGYILKPNESVTLYYNDTMSYVNPKLIENHGPAKYVKLYNISMNTNDIYLKPSNGTEYRIEVLGNDSTASYNVTAK